MIITDKLSFYKKILITFLVLLLGVLIPVEKANAQATGVGSALCKGQIFNPITDMDVNNFFPIVIMGARFTSGANQNSPLMDANSPICVCPTYLFGMPFFGIMTTFWEPLYISEIERRPGCLSSLGGVSILDSYFSLHSEQNSQDTNGNSTNRMQVHWYKYPVMAILNLFEDLVCRAPSGIALGYLTEIDPYYNNDVLGAIFAPESTIFANPLAQFACAVDSVAASAGYPMDALFWCAGTWGSIYPLTGNTQHVADAFATNNLIQAKFIARNHRMFLLNQTIGPSAICFSHPNPIIVKSQYRYNQVAPIPRKGRAVQTGDFGRFLTQPFITNVPTQEHTVNLIWQGKQCCVRF